MKPLLLQKRHGTCTVETKSQKINMARTNAVDLVNLDRKNQMKFS